MNRKIALALILLLCISSLSIVNYLPKALGQSGTSVSSQIITSNTTWTQADSPYIFQGPVALAAGVTLTIEPGTTVEPGAYYLQVNGTLVAIGTSDNKIQFNCGIISLMPSSSSWNPQTGIGCIFENVNCSAAIDIYGTSPKIVDNTIAGEIWMNGGAPLISDNIISNQIQINGGSPIITNNSVINTITTNGIVQESEGSPMISGNDVGSIYIIGSPTITNNTINGPITYEGTDGSIVISQNTIISTESAVVESGMAGVGLVLKIANGITLGGNYKATIADNEIANSATAISGSGGTGSTVTVSNNIMKNDTQGIILSTAALVADENLITDCQDGIEASSTSALTIQDNTISNTQIGIQLTSSPLSVTIAGNNLENNSNYQIQLLPNTPNNVNAANNWWGTTNAQAINQTIFDSKDNYNLGTVTFEPFLTTPNPEAPSLNIVLTTPTQSSTPSPIPTSSLASPNPTATVAPQNPTTVIQTKTEMEIYWLEVALFIAIAVIAALALAVVALARKGKVTAET